MTKLGRQAWFLKKVLNRVKQEVFSSQSRKSQLDWASILKNDQALWHERLQSAKGGPKVLIATSTGGDSSVTIIESLLAVALTLRGAEVHFLLCDCQLPACMRSTTSQFYTVEDFFRNKSSQSQCKNCYSAGKSAYQPLQLPIHLYSQFITPDDAIQAKKISDTVSAEMIPTFCMDNIKVGEHALAGTLRFFGTGSLQNEVHGEAVLRRYLKASILAKNATGKLLDSYGFDSVCFHHGIYVPQGLIGEVSRDRKIHVVNWAVAYRKQCFIFSHDDTYHHTMITEPVSSWENINWNSGLDNMILEYLKSRWQGSNDWIKYFDEPEVELNDISRELGINFTRPCVCMLTNVMWDAQLFYASNAFSNMLEWVFSTIRYFASKPDLQLIIRIHPAEVRGAMKSQQPMLAEITKEFPDLPDNVIVIPPESQISTYAVASASNATIIYGTKTGVELTSVGIPVIVAGEAWIRNKGLTFDASSPTNYFNLLDQLPLPHRLADDVIERARKYAFHFFFRRMIPINCVKITGYPSYCISINNINALLIGKDQGIDVICDGILKRDNFIYPAELF